VAATRHPASTMSSKSHRPARPSQWARLRIPRMTVAAAEEGQETEQVEQGGDRASATRPAARQTVRAERRRRQTPTSTAVAMAAPSA
jgi:hypothetical protein